MVTQVKSLSMVTNVILYEGGNEIVWVIISLLQPQQKWYIRSPALLFELVRQQLILQEFVILTLHKPAVNYGNKSINMHKLCSSHMWNTLLGTSLVVRNRFFHDNSSLVFSTTDDSWSHCCYAHRTPSPSSLSQYLKSRNWR